MNVTNNPVYSCYNCVVLFHHNHLYLIHKLGLSEKLRMHIDTFNIILHPGEERPLSTRGPNEIRLQGTT